MKRIIKTSADEKVKQTTIENLEREKVDLEEDMLKELIRKQSAEINDAVNTRVDWQAKQNKWYRQRYGLRQKAVFPWYNASSQHLPMQDSTIRKFKPEYVSVGYAVSPMCELTTAPVSELINATKQAENQAMSESASWHFDWLLRTRMDVFEPMVLMVDKMLHRGFAIVKTIYVNETEPVLKTIYRDEEEAKILKEIQNPEDADIMRNPAKMGTLAALIARQYGFDVEDVSDLKKIHSICAEIYKGTEAIEFTVEETVYDAPRWVVLDPEEIIVPNETDSVFDLEKATYICHRYNISPAKALKNGLSGKWDIDVVDSQLTKCGIYDQDIAASKYNDKAPATKDTTSKMQKRTREGLGLGTSNTDLIVNEVCLWYDSDHDGVEERFILEYFEGSEKALRFIRYPYSMKMWPYVKVIFELAETRHYSNRGTVEIEEPLATALNVQHNMKINRQTISSTPTLLYAVNKINPYNLQYIPGQPVPVEPPIDAHAKWFMPSNTDDTFMREEQTLKGWDNDYLAANDYGNPDETATKTKYNAGTRVGIRTLDIQIFQKALKEIYKRTWALWLQYSTDSQFIFTDSDGTTKVLDKAALFRDYMFQPMGSFGQSNPQLSAQIAARQFEEFKQDPMIDQYELYREYITKQSDPRTCRRILKSKTQIADDQKAAAAAQEQAHQRQMQEMVVMAQMGVKPVDKKQVVGAGADRRGMQQIKGTQRV